MIDRVYDSPIQRKDVCILPSGETVYRQYNSLVLIPPDGNRSVLSCARHNGGYIERMTAVYNTHSQVKDGKCEKIDYDAYLRKCAEMCGVDFNTAVSLGTAVHMDEAVIETESKDRTCVSAIVTAGCKTNAGRAGDPASGDELEGYCKSSTDGTIVIILVIDADVPPTTMARAMVTATEAKTAAMQDLMIPSRYSTGLATGTGTDQVAVVCNHGSPYKLSNAGKHSFLGEVIGKCVKRAVTKALMNHNGYCPATRADVSVRLDRFGYSDEDFLRAANTRGSDRERYLAHLRSVSKRPELVAAASAAIQLRDESVWGLVSEKEAEEVGCRIVDMYFPTLSEDPKDITGRLFAALSRMTIDSFHRTE